MARRFRIEIIWLFGSSRETLIVFRKLGFLVSYRSRHNFFLSWATLLLSIVGWEAAAVELYTRQLTPISLFGGQELSTTILVNGKRTEPFQLRARVFQHAGGIGIQLAEQLIWVSNSEVVTEQQLRLNTPVVERPVDAEVSVEIKQDTTWETKLRFPVRLYPSDGLSHARRWIEQHSTWIDPACDRAIKELFLPTGTGSDYSDVAIVCTENGGPPLPSKWILRIQRSRESFAILEFISNDTVLASLPHFMSWEDPSSQVFLVKAFATLIQSYKRKELL